MLKGSYFAVDATPLTGTPLAYDIQIAVDDPLYLKGFVFLPEGKDPVVICSLDWIGIACESRERLKKSIASSVGTKKDNVTVHTTHFHDAPHSNESAREVLMRFGKDSLAEQYYDPKLLERLCENAAKACREAASRARAITHIGYGKGKVKEVASNRRIVGEDGKIKYTRYSSCKDPLVRAIPEGLIDPYLDLITFWSDDLLLASVSYYATHPMSYYRTAMCSSDFVGMARNMFSETVTRAPHIYFNGAGGNITAGKYNDGEKKNRFDLANRLLSGMKEAWDSTVKKPVESFCYTTDLLRLPIDERFGKEECLNILKNPSSEERDLLSASRKLAWYEWCDQNPYIAVSALSINDVKILHMPGELFIEYQLYAEEKYPEYKVCMAAYGEYGTSYIGTKKSYFEGGYETGPKVTKVAEDSEPLIKECIDRLMKKDCS
jgi:hypothetical protein